MADTRLESFPFDSKLAGYDDYGYPIFDRAVGAYMLRETFKKFFSDGVFPSPGTALNISKGEGLNVRIAPGLCIVKGAMAAVTDEDGIAVQLDTASPQGKFAYGIFLRYDENVENRSIYVSVRKGEAGASPNPPEPERSLPGIYELRLGYVVVPSGATDLSGAEVHNEKGLEYCPFAAPFEEIDMSGVTADAMASADEALTRLLEYFEINKGLIDSALDDTTAGYLQTQINDIRSQMQDLDFADAVDGDTIGYDMKVGYDRKKLHVSDNVMFRLATLEAFMSGEVTSNPWQLTFENADGARIVSGTVDTVNKRITPEV